MANSINSSEIPSMIEHCIKSAEEILMKQQHSSLSEHSHQAVDKAVRTTFAYLMKYGHLDIQNDENK